MKEIDSSKLLAEMRSLAAQAQGVPLTDVTTPGASGNFGELLKQAIDGVNEVQNKADDLKQAFEVGEQGVDLPQVMVATQKAKVAFSAMVEVRNKLLEAYQEVMRMQV
ncbi:MAG: flagellar hook-basal body complex protein FliE [Gammaproteobacteria bacterium]|nr:flagellar hook-basal body complex protein FliE [Gammaproteobacteria bacterium]